MSTEGAVTELDQGVKDAAEADLYDSGDEHSEALTAFYAEILLMKQEAVTLRQRAIEASAINSFAARSELGQMEGDLVRLHDSVRSAYQALLTHEYAEFDRVQGDLGEADIDLIRQHQAQIRRELDAVSSEVIRTRSAISDQKVSQMVTSGLILSLVILLITGAILFTMFL